VTCGLAFVVIRAAAAFLESFGLGFVVMRPKTSLITTNP
jgi:hypothetical protein